MELNLPPIAKKILLPLLLLVLPWIIIIAGLATDVATAIGGPWAAWYYILAITWFISGIIFYTALN